MERWVPGRYQWIDARPQHQKCTPKTMIKKKHNVKRSKFQHLWHQSGPNCFLLAPLKYTNVSQTEPVTFSTETQWQSSKICQRKIGCFISLCIKAIAILSITMYYVYYMILHASISTIYYMWLKPTRSWLIYVQRCPESTAMNVMWIPWHHRACL